MRAIRVRGNLELRGVRPRSDGEHACRQCPMAGACRGDHRLDVRLHIAGALRGSPRVVDDDSNAARARKVISPLSFVSGDGARTAPATVEGDRAPLEACVAEPDRRRALPVLPARRNSRTRDPSRHPLRPRHPERATRHRGRLDPQRTTASGRHAALSGGLRRVGPRGPSLRAAPSPHDRGQRVGVPVIHQRRLSHRELLASERTVDGISRLARPHHATGSLTRSSRPLREATATLTLASAGLGPCLSDFGGSSSWPGSGRVSTQRSSNTNLCASLSRRRQGRRDHNRGPRPVDRRRLFL